MVLRDHTNDSGNPQRLKLGLQLMNNTMMSYRKVWNVKGYARQCIGCVHQ